MKTAGVLPWTTAIVAFLMFYLAVAVYREKVVDRIYRSHPLTNPSTAPTGRP